jgi:DNA repair protein RadC
LYLSKYYYIIKEKETVESRGLDLKVNKYRAELDGNRLNVLVKESEDEYTKCEELTSPDKVVDFVNSLYNLRGLAEEYLYMLALDTRGHVIGVFELSHGTVISSMTSPREIFIRALLCGAVNIVLVHNHPSGNTSPSKEDIKLTERVLDVGKLVGVSLADHVIVGDGYFSFGEEGYIQ